MPLSHDEEDLVDLLAQTSFLVMGVLTRVAADQDLSLTQFRVLAILRDRTLRMSALADYLGLEKSTMSGLIDRAAARGLVRRGSSPSDRRAIEVSIAPAGTRLVDACGLRVRQELAADVGRLGTREQTHLHDLLARLLPAGPEDAPQSESSSHRPGTAGDEGRSG